MKLTVYDTGMSGFEVEGDITLTAYDQRTDDFEIRIARKNIQMASSLPGVANSDEWEWLKDYPIQSLELDGFDIEPVWSYNKYGEESDMNRFQTVTVTEDEIIIAVRAGGTHIEVFNNNLPYINRHTGKEDYRTWQERENDTQSLKQSDNRNPVDPQTKLEKWRNDGLDANDIAKKLFE